MRNEYTSTEYWQITVKETHDTHVVFECENTDTDEIKFVTIEFKDFEHEFDDSKAFDTTTCEMGKTNDKDDNIFYIKCSRGMIHFYSSDIIGIIE